MARIEVSGDHLCCPACGTTPGTRRWHAELQRFCAARTPAPCGALACPMGPTRARCRAGLCEATIEGFVQSERRCLPALVCDAWDGCTVAVGNTQDGWFVEQSPRVARGELVALETVATATDAGRAEAFRLNPAGVTCPPHSIPPILGPPPSCAMKDGSCTSR